MKTNRGPPDINLRDQIRVYLTDESSEKTGSAVKQIVTLCSSNCIRLFIPVERNYGRGSPKEAKDHFIENWVADRLSQLTPEDLSRVDAGEFDYWPNACRWDLVDETKKQKRRLARFHPISLEQTLKKDPTLGGRFAGKSNSFWNHGKQEFQLNTELATYCEDNHAAFQELGTMGAVIMAFAKMFPLPPTARSVARELGIEEKQASRYVKRLAEVLRKEIAGGNIVVQGLYRLLQTGDDERNLN
jgi:hypothetical protein